MAIRPSDAYPGKVGSDANYPDGKAQNITSPGDGTGTPWEAQLVNDIFGFQQYLTKTAGITPSGTPDNANSSQYFEAVWKLLNLRKLTFNIVSNANLTLSSVQNLFKNIIITDTGVILTAGRNVIVDNIGRMFLFTNSTAQTLTVKTPSGTGVAVPAGSSAVLVCDEVNVINFNEFMGININGLVNKTTPVNTDNFVIQETGGLLKKLSWSNLKAALFNGTISLTTNGYIKLPTSMDGLIIQWGITASDIPAGGSQVITFPTAFPTNIIGYPIVTGSSSVDSTTPISGVFSLQSQTGFTLRNRSTVGASFSYRVIGY